MILSYLVRPWEKYDQNSTCGCDSVNTHTHLQTPLKSKLHFPFLFLCYESRLDLGSLFNPVSAHLSSAPFHLSSLSQTHTHTHSRLLLLLRRVKWKRGWLPNRRFLFQVHRRCCSCRDSAKWSLKKRRYWHLLSWPDQAWPLTGWPELQHSYYDDPKGHDESLK